MSRPLSEIVAEMRSWAECTDLEVAHSKADDLLVEAVTRLSPYATETADEGWGEALVEAYHLVGKWYA